MSLIKDLSAIKVQPTPIDKPVVEATPSGFDMIREFNVQAALKTSDGSDAGKTDVVDRAAAASDVGFNLMRNTINSNGAVTGSDVADYIERAEELNDEVDTVPFGLETDDGKIVKVYVNAEQADKFEEAMKNMLGLEDDIEEAINRLTSDFDIVDVVWPGSDDEDGDGVPDPDQDLEIDGTSNLDPEDDDDFADDQYDVIAGGDEAPPEADPGTGKAKAADAEDEPEDEPVDDEEPADDESTDADDEDEDEDSEEDEDDEEPDPDNPDKPKKKKKKKKDTDAAPAEPAAAAEGMIPDGPVLNEKQNKQEKQMTIGAKFLDRIMQEAEGDDRDGVKDGFNIPLDSQARAMAAKQKLPWAKRLVAFHFMCGVPGRYMNTAEVTEAIASAADMLRQKVAVRRAFSSLYEGLAAAKGFNIPADDTVTEGKSDAKRIADQNPEKIMKAKEAVKKAKKALADHNKTYDGGTGARAKKLQADIDVAMSKLAKLTEEVQKLDEAKAKRGSFIQKLLESVLIQLGLPESMVVTSGPAVVGTGIYNTAELIEQDSELERALRMLATRMGIKGQDAMEPVQEVETDKRYSKLSAMAEGINRVSKDRAKKDGWYVLSEKGDALSGPFESEAEARAESKGQGKVSVKYGKVVNMKFTAGSVTEAVDVGNDDFAQAVTALVSALGIPDDILERRRTQVVQALRQKKASLRNRAQVLTMIGRLQDILQKNTVQDSTSGTQPTDDE